MTDEFITDGWGGVAAVTEMVVEMGVATDDAIWFPVADLVIFESPELETVSLMERFRSIVEGGIEGL
jgi:hypothetical protein